MLKLTQLKIECGRGQAALDHKIRRLLRLGAGDRLRMEILRHSVDARKKPLLYDIYTVAVTLPRETERRILAKKTANVAAYERTVYRFPYALSDQKSASADRPVVIGAGPAGLFCAYFLAEAGLRPVLLERGAPIEKRTRDVEAFWDGGPLDLVSNVQFGEGGAGAFSDGKLNTLVGDKAGRAEAALRLFVACGAPEDILYENKPHIGTDVLRRVIVRLREEICAGGGEIRFYTQCTGLQIENGRVTGVHWRRTGTNEAVSRNEAGKKADGIAGQNKAENRENGAGDREAAGEASAAQGVLPASAVVLAPGHSARDTFEELLREGVPMTQKDFAVGFRVSHPQALINESQYGIDDPQTLRHLGLAAAPYKLTARSASGRGVYSFCMCPGGYVVNASSEQGRLAVNGMSYHGRDSARANSAIVMTVSAADFVAGDEAFPQETAQAGGGKVCGASARSMAESAAKEPPASLPANHPLKGMEFQRRLEERAFALAGGKVPIESFSAFAAALEKENGAEDGISCAGEAPAPDDDAVRRFLHAPCIKGPWAFAPLHGLLPRPLAQDFVDGMRRFDGQIHGFAGPEAYVIGLESRTSSPVRIVRGEDFQSAVGGLYPCGEGAGYAGGIMSAAMDGIKVAEAVACHFCGQQIYQ